MNAHVHPVFAEILAAHAARSRYVVTALRPTGEFEVVKGDVLADIFATEARAQELGSAWADVFRIAAAEDAEGRKPALIAAPGWTPLSVCAALCAGTWRGIALWREGGAS